MLEVALSYLIYFARVVQKLGSVSTKILQIFILILSKHDRFHKKKMIKKQACLCLPLHVTHVTHFVTVCHLFCYETLQLRSLSLFEKKNYSG